MDHVIFEGNILVNFSDVKFTGTQVIFYKQNVALRAA